MPLCYILQNRKRICSHARTHARTHTHTHTQTTTHRQLTLELIWYAIAAVEVIQINQICLYHENYPVSILYGYAQYVCSLYRKTKQGPLNMRLAVDVCVITEIATIRCFHLKYSSKTPTMNNYLICRNS